MSPALNPGDHVLVNCSRVPSRGDVLVARHPYRSDVHVIKRVVDLHAGGAYIVHGDNPDQSTDSRSYGPLPFELVYGTVTSAIR